MKANAPARRAALAALASAGAPIPAGALGYFVDGNELYGKCLKPDGTPDKVSCVVYITAITDALEVSRKAFNQPACLPAGVVAQQVTDVVVEYLRSHPVERSANAALSGQLAIMAAWCPSPAAAKPPAQK